MPQELASNVEELRTFIKEEKDVSSEVSVVKVVAGAPSPLPGEPPG